MSDTRPGSGRAAVLDACALVPIRLTQTLLWLAEAGLFELLWSEQILDEVQRNLPKVGITPERAAHRVSIMRDAFGEAALVDDFDHLIEDMTCDAKDRHVLAAAVRAEADLVVTFNLKDFPPASTTDLNIDVVHPDAFLTRLLAEHPVDVLQALRNGCAELKNPPQTSRQFLRSLTTTVPIFANLTADLILSLDEDPDGARAPFTSLVSADEDQALAAFGEPGDLTDPAQTALWWWSALTAGNQEATRALTFDPSAWGDYREAIDMLANRSLASRVIRAVDAPDRIAFMRYVPEVASTAQVFAAFATRVTILTLVKLEDETWRVWGLGPAILAASEIVDG